MFLSRRYRPNKWPFYVLITIESALTVGLLALFGIAAPNLYRTKLWQDGSDNGFNSNPNAALYAAANYRPYTTPKPWSQFITNYNVVISVLSMFIMLTKSIMYILHCFPPILSAIVHAILIALYSVSLSYQAASDTSDPEHPQDGPPWYITKPCSVSFSTGNIGYCQQAKAAFACTCSMTGIFFLYFAFAVWSCIPSKEQREFYAERQEKKRLRASARASAYAELQTPRTAKSFSDETPTTGANGAAMKSPGLPPMTPRTLAFNKLGGTKNLPREKAKDLPLRNHFTSLSAPKSPSYALGSPELSRSPLSSGFEGAAAKADEESGNGGMYFPPPPKISTK